MYLLLLSSFTLISMSLCFMFLMHPLACGMTLILQTVLICISAGLMSNHMWFSYILFLIFLGATLILFIYVASLASNEVFKLSFPMMTAILLIIMISLLLFTQDFLLFQMKDLVESSFTSHIQMFESTQYKLKDIYNTPISPLTGFVILYLLLTLVVVVKLSSNFYGPLRLG
uniref:NADH-ubiquinone oxidoreductase chain 6 n=1 Tax=Palaemon capensis TaxID=1440474 RepID=A0A385JEK1_9EUCA|nr:NADH dehydrogenase subunit 6 [Palaemon capensis]AXY96100.1 NADH dehydrogenase subunit 6 [Palaemon capensis]